MTLSGRKASAFARPRPASEISAVEAPVRGNAGLDSGSMVETTAPGSIVPDSSTIK